MNNDLEFNYKKRKNVVENIETVFLNLVLENIPNNKRNAIKYLENLKIDIKNEDKDIYGYLSATICENIINNLVNKIKIKEIYSNETVKDIIKELIPIENNEESELEIDEDEIDYEIEQLQKKKKQKIEKEYNNLININDTNDNNLKYFQNLGDNEKKKYVDELKDLNDLNDEKPILLKLVDLNTSKKNKKIILNNINNFNTLDSGNNEYAKLNNWINNVMNIPFDHSINLTFNNSKFKEKITKFRKILDDNIYGHELAKNKLTQYIAEILYCKNKSSSNILLLQGPPGIGKTALIKDGLAKAFDIPFNFIPLGGATDASFLEGFEYTYEGSTPGKLVSILSESKCMNPVIYFDELDKVSETAKGQEIISILTHITDATQNEQFIDKYFSGIEIDLSKVIFIFSCNDLSRINKVLLDRMEIIKLQSFSLKDKINISNKFIIPNLNKQFNFKKPVQFNNDVIEFLIQSYTCESGIRKLKEIFNHIFKEINLRNILNKKILKKKIEFPLKLSKDMIFNDILKHKREYMNDTIHKEPSIGLINGLWANDHGMGGIVPIEIKYSIATDNLELELTGSQGDVMKESMKVAKTVALNLLSNQEKDIFFENLSKTKLKGIHIHCPDGATPIDGPSAGCAIAIGLYSLFTNKKIKNDIAITGELTLSGNITEIGGLKEKIYGAISAKVNTVLYPNENQKDLDNIIKNDDSIKDKIKFICINTIFDATKYIFD